MEHSDLTAGHEAVLEQVAWMRQLAFELVRDRGTADDLVQETWLAVLRAKPDADRPLRPWLSRVVRNAAALRLRRGASRAARESDVATPERLPSAHQLVERAEEQQRLGEAVLALDDPYRTVVLLRYYEGLTPQQIAAAQGIPAATVRSQLHRGLAKLRERLDREHGGDRRAWVMMLQPLWEEAKPAAAGLSGGVLIGAGAVAAALLWLGVSWALRDETERALEPHSTQVAAPIVSPGRVALDGGGRTPLGPVVEPATELEWTLLDARTSARLADYLVRVDGEDFRSDAAGRVVLPADAKTILPVDDPRAMLDVLFRHERRELRALERDAVDLPRDDASFALPLDVGPTYRLDLVGPSSFDPRELDARLVALDLEDGSANLRPRQVAPVRVAEDGGAWVRFARRPSGADRPEARWRLELSDSAGFLFGSASLDALDPSDGRRVRVELQATGTIAGRITGFSPDRLNEVTASLRTREGEFIAPHFARPDASGDYRLRWIPAGDYQLHVIAPGQSTWTSDVVVASGRATDLDCEFDVVLPAGPVAGTVVSETGGYQGQLLVFLFDANGFVLDVFPTSWKRNSDGALEAPFRFDYAPTGELHVDVLSLADAVTFRVDVDAFVAPLEDLRVTLLDAAPADDWSFRVVDAETGAELAEYEVEVRVDDGEPRRFRAAAVEREGQAPRTDTHLWTTIAGNLRWNRFEAVGPLRSLPTSSRLAWTVRADGYLHAEGTEASFELDPNGSGLTATVPLRPE